MLKFKEYAKWRRRENKYWWQHCCENHWSCFWYWSLKLLILINFPFISVLIFWKTEEELQNSSVASVKHLDEPGPGCDFWSILYQKCYPSWLYSLFCFRSKSLYNCEGRCLSTSLNPKRTAVSSVVATARKLTEIQPWNGHCLSNQKIKDHWI